MTARSGMPGPLPRFSAQMRRAPAFRQLLMTVTGGKKGSQ